MSCCNRYIFYKETAVSLCLRSIFYKETRGRAAGDLFFTGEPRIVSPAIYFLQETRGRVAGDLFFTGDPPRRAADACFLQVARRKGPDLIRAPFRQLRKEE